MSHENPAKAAGAIRFDKARSRVRSQSGNRTLVIGESLIDIFDHADGSVEEHVGGSPANVAVGLARLGHDVTFATMIGDDERGARIVNHLQKEGVSLTEGSVGGQRTSAATSTLDATGAATYSFDLTWKLRENQRHDLLRPERAPFPDG